MTNYDSPFRAAAPVAEVRSVPQYSAQQSSYQQSSYQPPQHQPEVRPPTQSESYSHDDVIMTH